MIKPTIGRVVLVYRPGASDQFEPALITYVHSDTLINVAGFSKEGQRFSLTSLKLDQERTSDATWAPKLQESEAFEPFSCWMPYQKIQQAKNELTDNATLSNSPA